MAVVIDASVNGVSSNSYETLAEFETYLLTKLHLSTAVSAATTDTKNRALVSFTSILDNCIDWYGYPATTTQARQWGRSGMVDALGNAIETTEIPQGLKDALSEGAIITIDTDLTAENAAEGVSQLKVGPIYAQFSPNGPPRKPIPDVVWEKIRIWGKRISNSSQVRLVRC